MLDSLEAVHFWCNQRFLQVFANLNGNAGLLEVWPVEPINLALFSLILSVFGRVRIMVSQATVRQRIAKAVRTADLTTASAKQIRRSVETQLGLERDELASGEWKPFVKTVIDETMSAIERGEAEEESEEEETRIVTAFGEG